MDDKKKVYEKPLLETREILSEVTALGCSPTCISDIRLKKDIELIGQSKSGHNLYSYRYLWSDQVYVGVMAQEIQDRMPEAVVEGRDGFIRVNYNKLGLKLQTWEEWQAQEQTIH